MSFTIQARTISENARAFNRFDIGVERSYLLRFGVHDLPAAVEDGRKERRNGRDGLGQGKGLLTRDDLVAQRCINMSAVLFDENLHRGAIPISFDALMFRKELAGRAEPGVRILHYEERFPVPLF